jgi:ABC-2 type transport system permease protein
VRRKKMHKNLGSLLAIYKKEIHAYFYSPIAYIFLFIFIMIPNFLLFYIFGGIFQENTASMRTFFSILPMIFVLFIPCLSMGSWSQEKNLGTIELLFTFPISEWLVLLGKFLASLTLMLVYLFSTFFIPFLTNMLLGNFDFGQIFSQYFGAILLAGACISITFFFSSLTKELIISFLLGLAVLLVLNIIGIIPNLIQFAEWLGFVKQIFIWSSLYTRFENFSKGVIDSRDILYYLGVIAVFFYLNLRSLESRKWR